jgi:hypothetical protein
MKKTFALWSISISLVVSAVSADSLKNSLTSIMNEKETSSVVDLGEINLNARPKAVKKVRKTRSSKATVATVNGHKIIKKDADSYLSQRTKGKVKNFDGLPRKQQKRLIEEMALPILVMNAAKEELSDEEKQSIYTRTWMRKEASTTEISDEQVLAAYNQLKQQSIDSNSTTPVPEFDAIKTKLKFQMVERTIVGQLLKGAKFTVVE